MALPVSLLPESLARCSRSQVSNATTRGRLRSARARRRSDGFGPLIVDLALDGEQGIDALDRLDAIGALLSRARSKNLRRACVQQSQFVHDSA
jgi:hypothetical protein